MKNQTVAGVIGQVYSTKEGVRTLDYTMSDMQVSQAYGWLQTTPDERVPVTWTQGGHTWCYWKRDRT